jgi:peptide-methionine (S)-S-oxide reductase
VGYAGGTTENPTYQNIGDHTETIQIEYDPTQVSYQELLDVFWGSHTPTAKPLSKQYASIIFYHDEKQKQLATASRDRAAARVESQIYTEIRPTTTFYPAEDYHQKYWLRHRPDFMREFRVIYPDDSDFVASTAAARVNGYLNGYGTLDALAQEADSLGLSPEMIEKLLDIVEKSGN